MIIRPPSTSSKVIQLYRIRKQFRQIDETAYFIDKSFIDYSYIDMYNADITF